MREAGFSRAKIAALRDLAAKAIDGTLPTAAVIRRLDDDAIVDRLVAVRGIGRWTVEMLLIFQLGRPDVPPVDDFGVRDGFRIACWRPCPLRTVTIWRTVAAVSDCRCLVSVARGRSGKALQAVTAAVETFDQASLQWPIRKAIRRQYPRQFLCR